LAPKVDPVEGNPNVVMGLLAVDPNKLEEVLAVFVPNVLLLEVVLKALFPNILFAPPKVFVGVVRLAPKRDGAAETLAAPALGWLDPPKRVFVPNAPGCCWGCDVAGAPNEGVAAVLVEPNRDGVVAVLVEPNKEGVAVVLVEPNNEGVVEALLVPPKLKPPD
jgi:hypothetical protein